MNVGKELKRFWHFLKQDTWQSWLVSFVLAFLFIKFLFFPALSFFLGTPLPIVVVESCSMHHGSDFDAWWEQNRAWYEQQDITKEDFEQFRFMNGITKGDIVIIQGDDTYETGDVIVFSSSYPHPLIHRLVYDDPYGTKGDNNPGQLAVEQEISSSAVLGKAVGKIPALGWIKLIFFDIFKSEGERGFC